MSVLTRSELREVFRRIRAFGILILPSSEVVDDCIRRCLAHASCEQLRQENAAALETQLFAMFLTEVEQHYYVDCAVRLSSYEALGRSTHEDKMRFILQSVCGLRHDQVTEIFRS